MRVGASISVGLRTDHAARDRNIVCRAREIRTELGKRRKTLLGADRLDYTQGQ